jgi:hypothetical protein
MPPRRNKPRSARRDDTYSHGGPDMRDWRARHSAGFIGACLEAVREHVIAHSLGRHRGAPAAFLRWLTENPHALTWPERPKGVRVEFGGPTQQKREAWFRGEAELIADALAELDAHGATGSRDKWWAFEGFTSVDCELRTEQMTLLIEGKRTERLSRSTHWFPQRNQLARNLEVAARPSMTTRPTSC